MVEVVKVVKEHVPALRFIGKRYTDADRDAQGGFAARWEEWFREGRFAALEALGMAPEHGNAYIGLMRFADGFEYWIGVFVPSGTPVPDGYDWIDLPETTFGTCWLYGREDSGELYWRGSPHVVRFSPRRAGLESRPVAVVYGAVQPPAVYHTRPTRQGDPGLLHPVGGLGPRVAGQRRHRSTEASAYGL